MGPTSEYQWSGDLFADINFLGEWSPDLSAAFCMREAAERRICLFCIIVAYIRNIANANVFYMNQRFAICQKQELQGIISLAFVAVEHSTKNNFEKRSF